MRRIYDRLAALFITLGGVAIIAGVLAVFLFILVEVLPLFSSPSHGAAQETLPAPSVEGAIGMGVDEHRQTAYAVFPSGDIKLFSAATGGVAATVPTGAPARSFAVHTAAEFFAVGGEDGRARVYNINHRDTYAGEGASREVETDIGLAASLAVSPAPVERLSLAVSPSGGYLAAATSGGSLFLAFAPGEEFEENPFADEAAPQAVVTEEAVADLTENLGGARVTAVVLAEEGAYLYAGTADGRLFQWDCSDPAEPVFLGSRPATASRSVSVTAMAALLGERSIAVGGSDGGLSVWFRAAGSAEPLKTRSFENLPGSVSLLANSLRNRVFLAADSLGNIGVFHSTTQRRRLLIPGKSPANAIALAPKGDAVVAAAADGSLVSWPVENSYSEISLKAVFSRMWYEGYDGPIHMWQSTGGTDEFEPKLGLAPIIFGTFKGAVYSLLFAVPIAVFAALCVSQFLHPSFGKYIKPVIEIMAGLPSVVIGFFAGLWLSPALEKVFPALVIMPFVVAAFAMLSLYLWKALGSSVRPLLRPGAEYALLLPALAAAVAVSLWLNAPAEQLLFSGDFRTWLAAIGLDFDQRNALVVGFAMGFAVIPIVFTIAEDAMSGVPGPLVAASLALGANRWQTAVRVVLPAASSGVMAAVVIGFGRAVGETMIVLMATGNTPLMDWNIFTGFRTLSANIAVELPEAPQGGGLYRLIFFTSLLLFVFTFALNTAAEVIRGRLGKKFGPSA